MDYYQIGFISCQGLFLIFLIRMCRKIKKRNAEFISSAQRHKVEINNWVADAGLELFEKCDSVEGQIRQLEKNLLFFEQQQVSWITCHKSLPPIGELMLLLIENTKEEVQGVLNPCKDSWLLPRGENTKIIGLEEVSQWKPLLSSSLYI